MKIKATYLVVAFLVAACAFVAGAWYGFRGPATVTIVGAAGARETVDGNDPTHPAHAADAPAVESTASVRTMQVATDKQQLMGVQVKPVEKAVATHSLRLFGRVAPDETRIYKIDAGIDGVIREVSAVTTGSRVTKNQWLATYFSLESRLPAQAYLSALDVIDRAERVSEGPAQLKLADTSSQLSVERMKNVGMSPSQIEEVRRTREVPLTVTVVAPAEGFVLTRNVAPGQRFEKGAEWYRIADLSRVWILADVFQDDAQYVRRGVRATVSLPNQGTTLAATVTEVLPQFDAATRTLKVRLVADNPGYLLRPDMFVDVRVSVNVPATIAVPVDAIIDSGLTKVVFVDRGSGVFESRQVETGWRSGDRVEIVRGLTPGERIVTSATFLIDSESRLRPVMAASGDSSKTVGAHAGHGPAADPHAGHHH
jgi:membrane fusion protein, copper/silver efflux system